MPFADYAENLSTIQEQLDRLAQALPPRGSDPHYAALYERLDYAAGLLLDASRAISLVEENAQARALEAQQPAEDLTDQAIKINRVPKGGQRSATKSFTGTVLGARAAFVFWEGEPRLSPNRQVGLVEFEGKVWRVARHRTRNASTGKYGVWSAWENAAGLW